MNNTSIDVSCLFDNLKKLINSSDSLSVYTTYRKKFDDWKNTISTFTDGHTSTCLTESEGDVVDTCNCYEIVYKRPHKLYNKCLMKVFDIKTE